MNSEIIHPEDVNDIIGWSRKFGVNPKHLNEAILQTGSLNPKLVKEYLKKDSWFYHPFKGTIKYLKSTINFLF